MRAWTSTLSLTTTAALLTAALSLSAFAIQPQRWVHSTEADFEAGETENVVVTNLGDLRLATGVETLGEMPEGVTIIYDIATLGDTTFIAAGPEGRLLTLKDGQITEVAAFADQQVFALQADEAVGVVTVAVSGETSKLVVYDAAGEVQRETELPDVRYIWDLAIRGDDDQIVVATGSEGKVLGIDADGVITELLDTAQANVLCLAQGPDGVVYAGTDTDGLVYRIDAEGKAFVVYDAAEPEVAALLVTDDGTLYLGTADAEQARPGRLEEPASDETGRPDASGDAGSGEGDGEAAPTEPVVEPPAELPVEPEPQPMDASADTPPGDEGATAEPSAPAPENAEATPAPADPATESPAPETPDASADNASSDETSAKPTDEQYDALREELRRRLLAARKSGAMAVGTAAPTRSGKTATATASAPSGSAQGEGGAPRGDKSGNAVYRIDPQGFVSEVFRESVMILKLTQRPDGKLLVATGNEGELYLVDPAAGETTVLGDLEPQQLLAMQLQDDGNVLVGGSNPATLLELSNTPAESGTYTSAALDAAQVSLWGTINLTAELSQDASILVETRTGNVADPELAGWSDWAEAGTASVREDADPLQPYEFKTVSPPARYIQYRLTLSGGDDDANKAAPVTVGRLELAYVTPNLRPSLTTFTAAYAPFAGVDNPATTAMPIAWEATDDNADRLLFTLEFKPAAADDWQTLAEEITETSHEWETRRVPDGRYRLRVTATDKLDNPGGMAMTTSRLAEPVLVDNTPPEATGLNVVVRDREASLSGVAKDAWSVIHSVAYLLDDGERYMPVLPDDLIYDSTAEAFSVTLLDLSQGGHTVTLRLVDTRGNASYVSRLFEVKK